jgi:NADH:ubiquinone oxidoreductase subunit 5 (subunit L)/multisubunit Na+/H+ antiporter MnhA subunit|tara:strand:- start:8122 stop:8556 length:435 start_codon:yes stop_codon:yes gene_type:complete
MYEALKHAHSGFRWIILILLVFAIFNAFTRKDVYEKKDRMIYLFTMISMHIMLLVGLVLNFISPKVQYASGFMKDASLRFYGIEHLLGMLLAIVIITIGRRKSENAIEAADKHKKIRRFYTIALVIVLAMIPWPFREALGGSWF